MPAAGSFATTRCQGKFLMCLYSFAFFRVIWYSRGVRFQFAVVISATDDEGLVDLFLTFAKNLNMEHCNLSKLKGL